MIHGACHFTILSEFWCLPGLDPIRAMVHASSRTLPCYGACQVFDLVLAISRALQRFGACHVSSMVHAMVLAVVHAMVLAMVHARS